MRLQRVLCLVALALLLAGCTDKTKLLNQQLQTQLASITASKDTTEKLYANALAELQAVDAGISALEAQRGAIRVLAGGQPEDVPSLPERLDSVARRIDREISAKTAQIRLQAAQIKSLQARLAEQSRKLEDANLRIDSLTLANQKLAQENAQLRKTVESLRAQLADARSRIKVLEDSLSQQNVVILDKVNQLNTAYYIVKAKDELQALKLIDKKGTFLGMKGRYEIARNVDLSKFTKIDITETKAIPIEAEAKKIKVLSLHPDSAYSITADGEKRATLNVLDENTFWNTSKLLVVMVDTVATPPPEKTILH